MRFEPEEDNEFIVIYYGRTEGGFVLDLLVLDAHICNLRQHR